jgi:hypothetical protein
VAVQVVFAFLGKKFHRAEEFRAQALAAQRPVDALEGGIAGEKIAFPAEFFPGVGVEWK